MILNDLYSQILKTKVSSSNEDVRDLVKDFEEKIVDFAYEVENNLTESIKDEQMGVVKNGQSLRESIENYKKSKYVIDKTMPYIRHLDNQVNMIDMFFHLMNSTRLELEYFSVLHLDVEDFSEELLWCLLCHKEPAPRIQSPLLGAFCLLLAGSLWHKGAYSRTFLCMEAN